MPRRRLLAYIEVTFAVVVWGASFIATKIALRDISPPVLVWIRFGIGFAILGVAVLMRRQFSLPSRSDLGYFALLGFLGITFHQWLQSTGLITSQASTTAWIVATIPVFMAILGWLFLKERLAWKQALGIGLAALGVLLVVSKGNLLALVGGQIWTPGDILIMISAVNWAVFSILSRRGLRQHPAALMMFYVMGMGWLFTTPLLLTGSGLSEVLNLTRESWLAILFLGIFCSGLAYIAWYDALQAVPASQVGAFLYIEPLVAVVVANVLLGEPLLAASLLGGVIILLGVWLVQGQS
jgi:drug/metabolite transporter (DMT)-like permease